MTRYEKESVWIETYVDVLHENKHRHMRISEIWHACNQRLSPPCYPVSMGWLKRMLKEWAAAGDDSGIEKVGAENGPQFYRMTGT